MPRVVYDANNSEEKEFVPSLSTGWKQFELNDSVRLLFASKLG